jgi:hypothetical protein
MFNPLPMIGRDSQAPGLAGSVSAHHTARLGNSLRQEAGDEGLVDGWMDEGRAGAGLGWGFYC